MKLRLQLKRTTISQCEILAREATCQTVVALYSKRLDTPALITRILTYRVSLTIVACVW